MNNRFLLAVPKKSAYQQFMEKAEAYLELKVDGSQPYEVGEVALMLRSIADQYNEFASGFMGPDMVDARFYVKEVRNGSLVFDFAAVTIGLMDQTTIISQFYTLMKDRVGSMLTPSESADSPAAVTNVKPEDAGHISDMVRAVAGSPDGTFQLAYREWQDGERSEKTLLITRDDADDLVKAAASLHQSAIPDKREQLTESPPERVLMRLFQHNQDPKVSTKERTNHKAVIGRFASGPKVLTYETEDIADDLQEIVSQVPYADTLFDVEVRAIYLEEKIKTYRLTRIFGHFPDDDGQQELGFQS